MHVLFWFFFGQREFPKCTLFDLQQASREKRNPFKYTSSIGNKKWPALALKTSLLRTDCPDICMFTSLASLNKNIINKCRIFFIFWLIPWHWTSKIYGTGINMKNMYSSLLKLKHKNIKWNKYINVNSQIYTTATLYMLQTLYRFQMHGCCIKRSIEVYIWPAVHPLYSKHETYIPIFSYSDFTIHCFPCSRSFLFCSGLQRRHFWFCISSLWLGWRHTTTGTWEWWTM